MLQLPSPISNLVYELFLSCIALFQRYPFLNCNQVIRLRQHGWNNLTAFAVHKTRFVRMTANVGLEKYAFRIIDVMFGLPEVGSNFLQIRFVPDGLGEGIYGVEMVITDSEQDQYFCKGGKISAASPVLHFHCFKFEVCISGANHSTYIFCLCEVKNDEFEIFFLSGY